MRGNFLDVPTDCPQRDERLGWTGDIRVFAATATLLYDNAALLNSWLIDLAAEQEPNGNVPFVIPSNLPSSFTAAGWGAAATVVPMTLGERYGDLELLRRQYPSMKAWVEHVKGICDERRVWELQSAYGLLTIDSVILATALRVRADHLVTTDSGFEGIDELSVVMVDDVDVPATVQHRSP